MTDGDGGKRHGEDEGIRSCPREGTAPPAADGSDPVARVSLRDPQFLRLLVDATPDVRRDRVAALRQAVATGSYSSDPARIADAIIRELTRPRA